MSSSSDDETDEGKTNLPVTPEQKGKECDDSQSRPNNYKSQKSLPGQETAECIEPEPGQTRKPSLGAVTSLPIPQRSHSQDENKPGAKQGKPLQRCPTISNHTSNNKQPPTDQKQTAGNSNGNGQGPPPQGSQKRKESVSWSPFGAIGKAMSSGVNIVGDATKAVGTGVVSGTKAVGTGVVSGTKAVGSGVVSVGTGVVKTASAVGDGVIEGTKVVGSGIADVTEMTANAAVSGAKAATAATVNTVNATVDETTNFVKEKKKSVNRHMRRTATYTAVEGDTLGVIAAKYKTTCEDLIELNPQLAERRVQLGEEIMVPVGGSRKMSRAKDTTNFLQGLSISLLEEDDDAEGAEMAETKCLINSDVDFGPRIVTNGYLMLDSGCLTLSWAREDPLTLTQEDITNIALIYGPVELPEFISLLDRNEYNHSAGHSLSEPEVFPIYDEEAELELDSASTATDDRSPALLHTQDSDDLSINDSYNRSNSVEDSPGPFPVTVPGNGPRDNVKDANDTQQKNETDDVAIEDGKSCSSDKDHCGDEPDFGRLERKMSRGRRSSSRRRTLSKERRQSLLFEDQMATYCFVEIAEGFCPSSKSSAGLEPAPELPPPSPKALSSSDSVDKPVSSPYWTMTNSSPAFVIRVPNESIVRLFSFLIRNYETKYLCSDLPLEPGLGFTILTMETLQNRCGEAKLFQIGAKLNPSLSVEGDACGEDPCNTEQNSLPKLHGESEILEKEDIEQIQERVPTRLESCDWTLAFTTSRDGFALSTLYRKVQDLDCPILMVIQDVDQVIFGGLLSEPPKVTDSFCGTGESWLFSVDSESGELKVFNWTTANQLFIKGSAENLVIGSSGGQFGLWFDGDLNKGRTQPCDTFGNPPLTPSSDFCVYCLECWAFLPDS